MIIVNHLQEERYRRNRRSPLNLIIVGIRRFNIGLITHEYAIHDGLSKKLGYLSMDGLQQVVATHVSQAWRE